MLQVQLHQCACQVEMKKLLRQLAPAAHKYRPDWLFRYPSLPPPTCHQPSTMAPRRTSHTLLALLAAAALVACASAERPPSHRRRLNDDSRSIAFVVSRLID